VTDDPIPEVPSTSDGVTGAGEPPAPVASEPPVVGPDWPSIGVPGVGEGMGIGDSAGDGATMETASSPAPSTSWTRRVLVAAIVVVVLAAASVTTLLLTGKTSADAAVASAVTSALNDRTAQLTLGGSMNLDGVAVPIAGSGSMDFTQNATQLQMQINAPGVVQGINETAVYVKGIIYLNMGALISTVLPGKSWLSMDLSQVANSGGVTKQLGLGGSTLNTNPLTILKLLEQNGNQATDIGPSTVDGQSVEGYSVAVPPSEIRSEIAKLPSWMQAAASTIKTSHVAYKVFINNAGQLVRMLTDANASTGGQSVQYDLSMDFSDYGAPVSIAAPPASQIASFQQFLAAALAQSGSTVH
jgi:hypothetical protein